MRKPKLVIFAARGSRSFSPAQRRQFARAASVRYITAPQTVPGPRFISLLKSADFAALTPRATPPLSDDTLRRIPRLKGVVLPTTGVEWLDVSALTRRGIRVAHCPNFCTASAAEFTFGLLLSLIRRIPAAADAARAGRLRDVPLWGSELKGKTLGVIGYGRIGRRVAAIAKGFGMTIIATDPHRASGSVNYVSLRRLLSSSDVVSLHAPLNSATAEMINAGTLGGIKRGSCLVNTSRPGLVATKAVLAALTKGKLSGYAVDLGYKSTAETRALVRHPKVLAVPHISWYTREAIQAGVDEWAKQILRMVRH